MDLKFPGVNKVKEENDANVDWMLQKHLKRMRYRTRSKQGISLKEFGLVNQPIASDMNISPASNDNESRIACHNSKTDFPNGFETSYDVDEGSSMSNGTLSKRSLCPSVCLRLILFLQRILMKNFTVLLVVRLLLRYAHIHF